MYFRWKLLLQPGAVYMAVTPACKTPRWENYKFKGSSGYITDSFSKCHNKHTQKKRKIKQCQVNSDSATAHVSTVPTLIRETSCRRQTITGPTTGQTQTIYKCGWPVQLTAVNTGPRPAQGESFKRGEKRTRARGSAPCCKCLLDIGGMAAPMKSRHNGCAYARPA